MVRTQEQIIADCERRYAELEVEFDRLKMPRCSTCKWYSTSTDENGYKWSLKTYKKMHAVCREPLVKGFRKYGVLAAANPMPCGREKALWQPKLTLKERIVDFLFG